MQEVFEKIIKKLGIRAEKSEKKEMDAEHFEYAQMYKGERIAFGDAIEIVKQEAEKYNNGWIPCSSGVMPRANGWYLVTNHLGVVQEQRWSANHWEKLRDDAVLAWRELPLPYQPKGERENVRNKVQ